MIQEKMIPGDLCYVMIHGEEAQLMTLNIMGRDTFNTYYNKIVPIYIFA